jgi:hypothetical protein
VVVDGGAVTVDGATGTWSVADVKGRAEFPPPTAPPPAPQVRDGPEPVAPPPEGTNVLDRIALGGRFDFTAAASGPLRLRGKDLWEAIRHEVIAYPRNASFQPKNFYRRIERVNGGEVRLVNGTIVLQELSGSYGNDVLLLHGARLPVRGLPKVQRWREISGQVAFHPPSSRYTPKLDRILHVLNPAGPFLIAGSWTNDKTGEFVKKDYDLIISSDTGSFSLTDRQIVLANIRGDATAVPAGIALRDVQAEVLGGRALVSGHWLRGEPFNPDSPARYAADVTVRDVDLQRLEARLADGPPRKGLTGRLYCEATLAGEVARAWPKEKKIAALTGDGQLEVVRGSLFQVPVLKELASAVGLKDAATAGDAAAEFTLGGGKVKLTNAAVNSPMLGLQGGGTIDLRDHGRLDLDIVAAPLADWRERLKALNIPVVGDVVSVVAGGVQKLLNTATGTLLYEFRAEGPVKSAKLTAVPAPVLTDTAAFVFGKMLTPPKPDHRPLDYLRRGEKDQPRADLARERQEATR